MALTPDLFEPVAEKDNPQGILAVVHQRNRKVWKISPAGIFILEQRWSLRRTPATWEQSCAAWMQPVADGLFLLEGGVDPYPPFVRTGQHGDDFLENPGAGFVRRFRKMGTQE